MKVVFHMDFYQVYTSDPAAEAGRMEAIVEVIGSDMELATPEPVSEAQIAAAYTNSHVDYVLHHDPYSIAALAAGGAIQAARIGLQEPAFGLIRPPGHHASSSSSWGFCHYSYRRVGIAHEKILNICGPCPPHNFCSYDKNFLTPLMSSSFISNPRGLSSMPMLKPRSWG